MTSRRLLLIAGLFALWPLHSADAAGRHYYSSWSYHPQRSYHYVQYYYKPEPTYTTYNYHYCIYYPSAPQYVYYYNPYSKHYWGRYDVKNKGYSLLAEADRKGSLKEIPESAFPAPGEMPTIPESADGERMPPPPAVPKKE